MFIVFKLSEIKLNLLLGLLRVQLSSFIVIDCLGLFLSHLRQPLLIMVPNEAQVLQPPALPNRCFEQFNFSRQMRR